MRSRASDAIDTFSEPGGSRDASAPRQIGTSPVRPDGIDKVTGRAKFGADLRFPETLTGKVLRSPHPHALIKSIDTSMAQALPGVKAVVTSADFQDMPSEPLPLGEVTMNYHDLVRNILAREKALYEGHAVAAVAATSASIACQALKLIKVDYEVLPHVIDVMEAIERGAPILHEDLIAKGVDPAPERASNVAQRFVFSLGDVDVGFRNADRVIERTFQTRPVHQGYIEPHACSAKVSENGQAELFASTQGHFTLRTQCAELLGMDESQLHVTASEIGGGFGGKTAIYLEPLALALSRKAGLPVQMKMSREEVFKATGPTSGAHMRVKIGATKEGRIAAGECELYLQAGAFPGGPVDRALKCAFAPYDLEHVRAVGFDIVSNRPKVAAYRAPGAPISEYAVECVIDELAKELGLDPLNFRLKNAAKDGTKTAYGVTLGQNGLIETLEKAKVHDHYSAPLGLNQGRGVASGFWFNIGGQTSMTVTVNEDGTVDLIQGAPDIGGGRASNALMAAEAFGIDYHKIKPRIGNTDTVGSTFWTGGSRATLSNGVVAKEAVGQVIDEMCWRAAGLLGISAERVKWERGCVVPAGENAGTFSEMTMVEIAEATIETNGPIEGHASRNVQGAAPSFGTHIVDVEVDKGTGRVTILRYTVLQDAGKAIHPAYVEGQYQGGAVQGIGWALSEEYIYGDDGKLQNPGFLDYRIPVASDVPMIDTVIVECPNPNHPYGVRGVGETPIVPALAAITNAVEQATGIRFTELPLSPARVLKAIEDHERTREAA